MLILLLALVAQPTVNEPAPPAPASARPHIQAVAAPDSLHALRVLLPAPARPVEPDRWLAWDKVWHFSASFVSVGAGYQLCANRLGVEHAPSTGAAMGGTLALGVGKEFLDHYGLHQRFSWKDLAVDALGIAAGYFVFVHRF